MEKIKLKVFYQMMLVPNFWISFINIIVIVKWISSDNLLVLGILNLLCLAFNLYFSFTVSKEKIYKLKVNMISKGRVSKRLVKKWSTLI